MTAINLQHLSNVDSQAVLSFTLQRYTSPIPAIHLHPSHPTPTSPLSNRNPSRHPPPPPPPRPRPQPHRHQPTHRHRPKRARETAPPPAQALPLPYPSLIHNGVDGAPDGRARGGHHGDDAPVGAEVLHAPHDADDDGGEGEDGAVARAGEGGHEREVGRVRGDEGGGEQEEGEGEEEGGGEEEGEAGEGEAFGWGRRAGWSEEVGERARDEARERGCQRDDGDVRGGGVGGGRGGWWGVQRGDDGAEIVDEGFARAGNEEEAAGQEPHRVVAEEAARFGVEEPGLLALVFVVVVGLLCGGILLGVEALFVRGVEGAVAGGLVGVGAVEEGAFFEEAAGFELLDAFFDELLFVDDLEDDGADEAHAEQRPTEEEEELEHVDVALASVGGYFVQHTAPDLALPHPAEAKCRNWDC